MEEECGGGEGRMGGKVMGGRKENGSWVDIGDRWEEGRMEDRVEGGEKGWEVRWEEGRMGVGWT